MKRFIKPALYAVIVLAFTALGINQIVTRDNNIQLKEVQLKSTTSELKQLQLEYDQNIKKQEDLLHQKNVNEQEVEKLRQDNEQKSQRIKELEQQVSAKREAARVAASANPTPRAYAATNPTGTCADWIAAAGITEVAAANELIRRESGCNPNAVNKSSGACGVAQELPCGKSGCALGDGACQVKWMAGYVKARYGSWGAAVAFHDRNNWY